MKQASLVDWGEMRSCSDLLQESQKSLGLRYLSEGFSLQGAVPKIKESEILQLLSRLRSILVQYEIKFWPEHLFELEGQVRTAYRSGTLEDRAAAIKRIRRIFGGMGSFNDLFIATPPGRAVDPNEQSAANKEFQSLRTQLYLVIVEEARILEESRTD
jgi:Domain of unknown function (DUF6966)